MTGRDVSPEKDLLEKAAAIKILEYSPLGSELKKQTDSARKLYQSLDNVYEFDETINKITENQHLESMKNQIEYMTVIIAFTNIVVKLKHFIIFL